MPTIWRLHIKPDALKGIDPHQFCLEKGILGVGWSTESNAHATWRHYFDEAKQKYAGGIGWLRAAKAIGERMNRDDLCWMRDLNGCYYLGRVTSDWRYDGSQEHVDADIVNVRDCEWLNVGQEDFVPGKVVNCFRARSTVQAVHDETASRYSMLFHDSKSQGFKYGPVPQGADIFSVLLPDDLEDVVGLYLQSLGYKLIPSSCKVDTEAHEFIMKHGETGRSCVAQVKSGYDDISVRRFEGQDIDVYLFTSKGRYVDGEPSPNVHCLEKSAIEGFLYANLKVMPGRIQKWVDWLGHLG